MERSQESRWLVLSGVNSNSLKSQAVTIYGVDRPAQDSCMTSWTGQMRAIFNFACIQFMGSTGLQKAAV